MPKGTVKSWNRSSAYGFIRVDQAEQGLYFHISSFREHVQCDLIRAGLRVDFGIANDDHGRKRAHTVNFDEMGNDPAEVAAIIADGRKKPPGAVWAPRETPYPTKTKHVEHDDGLEFVFKDSRRKRDDKWANK